MKHTLNKFTVISFFIALSTLSTSFAADENSPSLSGLPPTVLDALASAKIPLDNVGIIVQGADERKPSIEINSNVPLNPASVMKMVTTYASLEMLGAAFQWSTSLAVDSLIIPKSPDSNNGVLNGNLYFIGGGDPKFTNEQLWLLLRKLRLAGVSEISGDLVIDDSLFSLPPHDPAEFDGQPLRSYNVGPSAVLTGFATNYLTFIPDETSVKVIADPPIKNLNINNQLKASAGNCGVWRRSINAQLTTSTTGVVPTLSLSGNYPKSCGVDGYYYAILPPEVHLGELFRALWQELGGTFSGKVVKGRVPINARVIAEIASPPLANIVTDINKYSNNVMAQMLLLSLPMTEVVNNQKSKVENLNYITAINAINKWLENENLRLPTLVIENGSGLSRIARISPADLLKVLQRAWRGKLMPEFLSSLPISAVDGTLRNRKNLNKESMRLKTGTINDVNAIAGYVQDHQGKMQLVVFIINHPNAYKGKKAQDELLQWVVGDRLTIGN